MLDLVYRAVFFPRRFIWWPVDLSSSRQQIQHKITRHDRSKLHKLILLSTVISSKFDQALNAKLDYVYHDSMSVLPHIFRAVQRQYKIPNMSRFRLATIDILPRASVMVFNEIRPSVRREASLSRGKGRIRQHEYVLK